MAGGLVHCWTVFLFIGDWRAMRSPGEEHSTGGGSAIRHACERGESERREAASAAVARLQRRSAAAARARSERERERVTEMRDEARARGGRSEMARWRPPDGRDADGRNATKRGPDKPTRARQTDVSVEHRG